LRDLENGEDRFRHPPRKDGVTEQTPDKDGVAEQTPDKDGVSEKTFWDRCLIAVTDHAEKNEVDTIFKAEFKELLPEDWKPVEAKLMFGHIENLRSQLMTNAETMIATTFHRRIRESRQLQLLTSRIRLGVELNNKADEQLSSKLARATTCEEARELALPSHLGAAISQELHAFFADLAKAMKDVKARKHFYDSLKVLHFVQKHREECIDELSDEQQKKIPRKLKKSMAVFPLSSPSIPYVTLNPTALKKCYGSILGDRAKESTNKNEDLFHYCFPGL